MQGAVHSDHVTHLEQLLDGHISDLQLRLRLFGQLCIVAVQQLLAVKTLQALHHTLANAAAAQCAHNLVFQIVGVLGNGSHVPTATGDLEVGWHKVAHKVQDHHDHVLCHADHVATGHFRHGEASGSGSDEVHMVTAHPSCHCQLELGCTSNALRSQVGGVKGCGDQDLSVSQMLVQHGVGALLVTGDDVLIAETLEERAQTQGILARGQQARLALGRGSPIIKHR
mmetsp:Transcript_2134/g.3430  ORF Transcript_2134/g.3430 Transcript_2134/m.3430 type:complete len:226 (+) Transcript_2134:945-1622(+)